MYMRTSSRYRGSRATAPVARTRFVADTQIVTQSTANVPVRLSIQSALLTRLGISSGEGFRLVRLIVKQTAVPTTAIGAGTDAFFFSGVTISDANVAVAAQDPAIDATRDARKWLGMSVWDQPFLAAPIAANFTIPSTKTISRRWSPAKAPRLREADEDLWLVSDGTNAGQTWRLHAYVYTRWAMP